jgi:hypothetical protein
MSEMAGIEYVQDTLPGLEPEPAAPYVMNPDEDIVLPGSMLANGMRVLQDGYRHGPRDEEFCTVTLLAHLPPQSSVFGGSTWDSIAFVAVYDDGFQRGRQIGSHCHWIVKKESIPGNELCGVV